MMERRSFLLGSTSLLATSRALAQIPGGEATIGGCFGAPANTEACGQGPVVSLDLTQVNPGAPTSPMTALFNANVNYSYNPSGAVVPTVTDATGAVTYAGNNLLTYSNTFSNAAWVNSNTTATPGVADPNGGTAATTLTAGANNAYIYQSVASSATNGINTIWVKRRTGSGVVRLSNPSNSVASPIAVTSSWTRFYTSGVLSVGQFILAFTFDVAGDQVDVYAAYASAVTYETTPRAADLALPPTTSTALIGPRFPYAYNGSSWVPQGFLVEAGATNLALYSAGLGGTGWTVGGTNIVTQNATTAPDGSTTATRIQVSSGNGISLYQTITVVPGTSRTLSIFAKNNGGTQAQFRVYDATHSTNVVAATSYLSQLNSSTFTRVQTNYTVPAGCTSIIIYPFLNDGIGALTSDAYLWGVDDENSATATTYIPTGATAASRSPDVAQATGKLLATLQGASGSVFATITSAQDSASFHGIIGSLNRRLLYFGGSNTLSKSYNGTTVLSATIGSSGTWTGGEVSTGVSWSSFGRYLAANGGAAASDNGVMGTDTTIYIGRDQPAADYLSGTIGKLTAYSSSLSSNVVVQKSVGGL
jgi:hypothetical protein